jgi:hypothetical protein
MGTLEASRLQHGLGLSRASLDDERVNFVTDSVINNIAMRLSRCDLLSEPCRDPANQYTCAHSLFTLHSEWHYDTRVTHLVREPAPAIKITDIREALPYQRRHCVYCAAAASSFSTRSRSSIVSRTVSCHLT